MAEKTMEINVETLLNDKGEYGLPFRGSIRLKVRPYRDRLKLAQDIAKKGKGDDKSDLLDAMMKMADDNVTGVSIQIGKAKAVQEFTSLEEISYFKEGGELINRIAKAITEGPSLGNLVSP